MKIIIFLSIIFLISCTKSENVDLSKPIKKTHYIFQKDINTIFDGYAVYDLNFTSSFAADSVSFLIHYNDLALENFNNDIRKKLDKNGWYFYKKKNYSYIFCNVKKNQLEIIPPQKILKNGNLKDGNTLTQLVDDWNVHLISAKNITVLCSDFIVN